MSSDPKKKIEQMAPWFGEEEKRAVAEYTASGGWLTEYRKTAEFEQIIADYVGSRHAIVVTSGTAALFCALVGCGVGPGDEVIVPDFTMIATANAVVLAGARPVFVDIDPSNLCLDLHAAEKAIDRHGRRDRGRLRSLIRARVGAPLIRDRSSRREGRRQRRPGRAGEGRAEEIGRGRRRRPGRLIVQAREGIDRVVGRIGDRDRVGVGRTDGHHGQCDRSGDGGDDEPPRR